MVVGRSVPASASPVAAPRLAENARILRVHSRTRDLPAECRRADVVIAAVGRPEMVKGSWIKPGATVIDVGTSTGPKSELVGDVEFTLIGGRGGRGQITPVPGGVGPMTIAMLLRNTLLAAQAADAARASVRLILRRPGRGLGVERLGWGRVGLWGACDLENVTNLGLWAAICGVFHLPAWKARQTQPPDCKVCREISQIRCVLSSPPF